MLSDSALNKLRSYDYPGNVRELENIIEQAVSMADREHVLNAKHISMPNFKKIKETANKYSADIPLDAYMASLEEKIILEMMRKNKGNISKTAEGLQIKRQTLQHKLKKYNISVK